MVVHAYTTPFPAVWQTSGERPWVGDRYFPPASRTGGKRSFGGRLFFFFHQYMMKHSDVCFCPVGLFCRGEFPTTKGSVQQIMVPFLPI